MGNNFCSNIDVNNQEAILQKEVELNNYSNLFIRKKLKAQSQRLDTIYSIKQGNNKEEFILSIKPYNDLEAEDSVTVTLHNREQNHFAALYSITTGDDGLVDYKFQIEEQVIQDENQTNVMYTRAQDKNTNERYSLKIINFDDIQDTQFKEGVYEIAIHNKLKNAHDGENHPNIIQLKDSYILHCNERQVGKKSLILVYEYFDATLTEIIKFRKQSDWQYSEKQISAMLRDLVSAVHLMNHLGITHRDLRPCNIVYSSADKHFKIANFSEAKLMENYNLVRQVELQKEHKNDDWDLERLNTVRGVPEFLSPEILDQLHVNSEQQVIAYDAFKLDIYSLGVLMILMKRESSRLDFKTIETKIKVDQKPKISIDFSNWTLSGIIKQMVKPSYKERSNSHQIHMQCQKEFPTEEYPRPIECQLVQSLRYKTQKDTKEQYITQQSLIAKEYFKLYDMDMWLFKQSEILEEFIQKEDEVKKADIQYEIAEGYLQHSDLGRARDYYEKAAYIYNSLGHEFTQASNLEPAINYYNQAIDCVRKANNGEETAEQALLLENIGNAYRLKGELQKARAFQEEALLIIAQIKGEGSLEVARILNNIANVYAQLGFYKKADKRLKRALKISEQIYLEDDEKLQLQALCMTNLGEVHRLKGSLSKAQNCLEEALNIREQLLGSGHLQVADTVENLGNVEFDLGNYHQARKHYERSLVIKRSKLSPDNPEIALTLNNIGNVCKNMEEYEKAKKMYEDALLILTQKFGNDAVHPYMAISYGNLGIINLDQNNPDKGRQLLEKALNILDQIVGTEHPDFQFYSSYLQAPIPNDNQYYNEEPNYYNNNEDHYNNNFTSNNQSPQRYNNANNNQMNYQQSPQNMQYNNTDFQRNHNNNWQQISPSNY